MYEGNDCNWYAMDMKIVLNILYLSNRYLLNYHG